MTTASEANQDLLERHQRGRRLDRLAFVTITLAIIALLMAGWIVLDTVNKNTTDRIQNDRIQHAIHSDPCSSLSRILHHPHIAGAGQVDKLTVECRDFLDGLAQDALFSHALACYIVHRASLTSRQCEKVRSRNAGAPPGVHDQRDRPSAQQSPAAGSPPPPTPGSASAQPQSSGQAAPASPPSTPSGSGTATTGGGGSNPPPPAPPSAQPPGQGTGASVCVTNPLLPACLGVSLPTP